jgi:hypothetical protein
VFSRALVLYAIILHSDHKPQAAEECIIRASRISSSLGIGQLGFDFFTVEPDSVGAESLRRTWWELYIADCYFSALHRRQRAIDDDQIAFPHLPCEEKQYEIGFCNGRSVSLQAFQNRMFLHENVRFSSYSYRVEAIHILARVLSQSLGRNTSADDPEAVDHAITAWKLSVANLSTCDPAYASHANELLFQAQLFAHTTSILLHFPRSDLPMTVPTTGDISCAEGCEKLNPTSNLHTAQAILASKEIANLVALPCELDGHSPLFICGLIIACMVQLAAATPCYQTPGLVSMQHCRDRTALLLAALDTLGRRWRVAERGAYQLKTVAHTLFGVAHLVETPESNSVHDSGVHIDDLPANLSWFDLLSPMPIPDALQEFGGEFVGQTSLLPLS